MPLKPLSKPSPNIVGVMTPRSKWSGLLCHRHKEGRDIFERYTEKAISVIMLAQEEARRLGHNFIGSEQILLGLIGQGSGVAAKTLKSFGVNLQDVRIEVEKVIGRGSGFVAVEIPFTPRAKEILKLAWDESRQLGTNYIGTEHLLLGVIHEGSGVAVRVLENLGVDPTKVRRHVINFLGEPSLVVIDDLAAEERRRDQQRALAFVSALQTNTIFTHLQAILGFDWMTVPDFIGKLPDKGKTEKLIAYLRWVSDQLEGLLKEKNEKTT